MQISHKMDWICLTADDYWNSNPHSRYHIAKEFTKISKVLWVNSIGTRFPSIKKKKGISLIIRKIKSYLIYYRTPEPNLYVLSPLTIPVFYGSFVKRINAELLWLQIKIVGTILGLKNPSYFISSPSFGIIATKISKYFCIYYYSDLYTSDREIKYKEEMEMLDRKLYKISKLVYCCSEKICNTIGGNGKVPRYLPHSVDVDHFRNNIVAPAILSKLKTPIIGFYGSMTDASNWEIIDYITSKRPSFNFVFIGKKYLALPEIEKRPNVLFIDKIPYKDVPSYGACFDVAIMFWLLRDWILHSSPLKLLEYIALGKPVVSVDIPEVRKAFGDVVLIAKDKYSFLEKIDEALCIDKTELIKKYKKILENHSWGNVVERIYSDMECLNYNK